MSSPNASPPPSTDWQKLPALLKEWKEVIVILGGALTALFGTIIKAEGRAQIFGYALAVILLGLGAYVAQRVRRRRAIARQRALLRETFESRRLQRTAFRGLYPYQEGDILPGHQRKWEAKSIFTQVTDADFSFGIICGDSGCGKTSLLRCALTAHLKETEAQTGLRVLYVGNPLELAGKTEQADGLAAPDRLRQQLAELERAVGEADGGAPVVVILDQFEQFFIEYKAELRAQLGAALNALIHATPPARVLCAVRRDYLMDMRDLAPQLPEPFSIKGLFGITNFTPEQAADVVRECAARDGVALDEGLPDIIAEDLAEGGYVRPPQLQIVCFALVSNPTVAAYRLRGGATGILAHHIRSAVSICDDPKLGSQILRALCDFPSHAKRNPLTLGEILTALDIPSGLSREGATRTVADILAQFEAARIVQVEPGAKEDTYALVHDYLVNSVAAATSDDKTRVEKANQLLQYYIGEHSDDPKNKIPLRRHRFIRKYADKNLLNDPRARRLFKATRNARIVNVTTLLLLILASTAALMAILNTQRTWEPQFIDRVYPETGSVAINADIFPLQDSSRVLTLINTTETKYVKLWETKTAKLLLEATGDEFFFDHKGQFIIVSDHKTRSARVTHLATGQTYVLPIGAQAITDFRLNELLTFTSPDGVLLISGAEKRPEYSPPAPGKVPPPPRNEGVRIWSVMEERELGFVEPAAWTSYPPPYLTRDLSRLLTLNFSAAGGQWGLWDVKNKEWLNGISYADEVLLDFAVNEDGGKFVVLKSAKEDAFAVQMFDLRTGDFLFEQLVKRGEPSGSTRIYFSKEGDFVILIRMAQSESDTNKPLAVLNSSNLLPAEFCVGKDLNWAYVLGGNYGDRRATAFVYWSSDQGTHVWDTSPNPPKLFPGLVLRPLEKEDGSRRERLIVVQASGRVLVRRMDWRREMYDLNDGRKITELEPLGPDWGITSTFDGKALNVEFPGSTNRLYSLENGRMLAEFQSHENLVAFYDAECHRITAWSQDGQVLRYNESIKILGRWVWPVTKCRDSLPLVSGGRA